jgi:hypothetical protein
VASPAVARVHLTVRPDGTKVIYNDEVDGRGYRAVEMSDSWLVARRQRPCDYDDLILHAAHDEELDPGLVKSVMLVESGFNPRAVSRKGARGLMQLMPKTAQIFGVRNVFDVRENIRGGTRYLNYLLNLYHGDLENTLAAYNAGEGAVERYDGVPPYDETLLYVHKTLTAYFGKPYLSGGFGRARTGLYREVSVPGRQVFVARDENDGILLTTDSPGSVVRRR